MRVATTTLQNSFGKYLQMASEGQEIIITKNGRGIAQLKPYAEFKKFAVREVSGDNSYNHRVTYEEFLALSQKSESQLELIDGQIYLMSAPRHIHQAMVTRLTVKIANWLEGQPCEAFVAPYDIKLYNESPSFKEDPNVVQPDISVICDPDNINDKGYYEGIPTIVVEVLSPSTRSKDMIAKLSLYMKSSISEYWLVDTEQEEIMLYSFKDRNTPCVHTYRLRETLKSLRFKGLEIPLLDIFK